nr:11599_t:CDS:2 [Entrophospora candida]
MLANMWYMTNGKFVEEELYKLGLQLEYENAVHSFIIDVDDEIVKKHFNEEELSSIPAPMIHNLSDDIIEYLKKFVDKKFERFDKNYDKHNYHDLDYIKFTLYAL